MIVARQSTARTITIGPVLDASGVAVTDSVVGDFKIAKNGGAPSALNGSATLTHRHTGNYSLALTASDLDTVGQAEITCDDTVNACAIKDITVIEEAVYDELFASSALGYIANAPVNLAQWLGTAPLALSSQQVQAVVPVTQKVDVETIKTNAVVNGGTITFPTNSTLASTTNITAGTITTTTNLTNAPTSGDLTSTMKTSIQTELTTYGALKPTTAGRTLDVTATGAAGIDLANVENQSTTLALSGTTIKEVTDVQTTLTNRLVGTIATGTHNPQSGDAYARIGANGVGLTVLATQASVNVIDGIVDDILLDTAEIGTAGVGLTNLGGMSTTMKGQVQTEAEDAIVVHRLDELLNADSDIDGAAPPTVGSVFHELMTKTAGSFTYDQVTDSLEALRDRGDAAWTTATGFSTLDAAGVRTAVGLASANLDTQISDLDGKVSIIQAVSEQIDDTLEDQGGGVYGFTQAALQEAPTGGSAPTASAIADEVQTRTIAGVTSVTNRVTANVDQLGGSAQSLTDLKDFADTGYDPATHKVQGVVLVDTTTTNTDMRGTDNAALAATALSTAVWTSTRAGYVDNLSAGAVAQAAALTTVGDNVDSILADTNELQTDWANGGRLDVILDARASQTSVDDLPTNSELATALAAADDAVLTAIDALPTTAEVRTQCDDALTAINLDHLVKSAVDTNFATTVHLDSVIGQLADNGTTATFDRTTDSLEAVRDRGDAAWITATGFSTLDAAGVRSAVGLASANLDTQLDALPITSEVRTQCDDALVAIHLDHLLAATYDPSSKPGAADALLNELVENDGGVSRYTANALEQAPTGGSAPTVEEIADEVQTRTIAAVTLVATTTNLTNLPTMPTNWVTAAGLASDAVTEIQSGLATSTAQTTAQNDLDILTGSDGVTLATSQPNYAPSTASALTTVGNNVSSILSDTGTDGVVLSTATLQSIADTLLARNVSNVEGTAPEHSLTAIVLAMLESSRSGTTWTIKKTDGSTTFATKTLTVDADADPITGVT